MNRTLIKIIQFHLSLNFWHTDVESQKLDLFRYVASYYQPHGITWEKIADALDKMFQGDLAKNIRRKFCSDSKESGENDMGLYIY